MPMYQIMYQGVTLPHPSKQRCALLDQSLSDYGETSNFMQQPHTDIADIALVA